MAEPDTPSSSNTGETGSYPQYRVTLRFLQLNVDFDFQPPLQMEVLDEFDHLSFTIDALEHPIADVLHIDNDYTTLVMDMERKALFVRRPSDARHAFWVDGKRVAAGKRAELRNGTILSVSVNTNTIENSISLRCYLKYQAKPSARRRWRTAQKTPVATERSNQLLTTGELLSYAQTYLKNKGESTPLNLDGLLRLYKVAGMRGPWFDVRLDSGETVRVHARIRRNQVLYDFEGQLRDQAYVIGHPDAQTAFMNRAYTSINGETMVLSEINLELWFRCVRTTFRVFGQLQGTRFVGVGATGFTVSRDPQIPLPRLSVGERVLCSSGFVSFEDVHGELKDDAYSGAKIVPENVNPLQRGNLDLISANFGTLGHFASVLDPEEEGDETHYAITIGHVLEDNTTKATIMTEEDDSPVDVSIPVEFQRNNGTPTFIHILKKIDLKRFSEPAMREVGCMEYPDHLPRRCAIIGINCAGISQSLQLAAPANYESFNLDKRSPDSFDPLHLSILIQSPLNHRVYKMGAATGLTQGTLVNVTNDVASSGNDREKEKDLYYGVVAWDSPETPFAEGGDSGSLVYLVEGGNVIPLGIHKGSLEGFSYFLLINHAVGVIGEVLDLDVLFCGDDCAGDWTQLKGSVAERSN
ncbi:hypothetical protein F5884DRAFT_779212 [Xylogone sp. PMI_703]|nr:hypothetical protein F5884DRAFT_779212 [Xylogone sp. PMI_703]